ncbi:hypothetical protein [Halomonas litopenaei]|uniref:hypothetical protein n=1 Tax=Halomonas litopenaei TaxID=2109328 RepID=UPI001A8DC68B|nr:hypothetical protein [Halomonas litopenaei]MBN8411430.1 hypothetical protein [Halomonas litopenaei]
MVRVSLKIIFLLLALVSASTIWQQKTLSVIALQRIDPLPETRNMVMDERYAEAGEYLSFFMQYDYVSENPDAQLLYQAINEHRSHWRYQLSKVSEGLFQGTSDETIGQAVSVASDFIVIGDARDLVNQGVNYAQGEDVDEIMVALASLGILASSAQIVSGLGAAATVGAGVPALAGTTVAKSSILTLKAARRLGKLPSWLGDEIIKAAVSARQSRSLGQLGGMLENINSLARTRGGLNLLSKTKDANDLHRAARFTEIFGRDSATLYRIGGNTAIDIAQRAGTLGKKTILLAATFGQTGLKILDTTGPIKFVKITSRVPKLAYKGDLAALIAKTLVMLPSWLLYIIIALATWMWAPKKLISTLRERI